MQLSVACNLIPLGDRLDSDPTVDFLDKDAVGLNGLCSLSWCLHKYYHVLYVIAKLGLCHELVNCLAVICSPITCYFIYLRDSTSEPMAPGPSFYIVYNLIYLLFIIIIPLVTFHYYIYFIIQLTTLCSARPERLTTSSPLGTKYLVECVQVHVCWRYP